MTNSKTIAASIAAKFVLDRKTAVTKLLGRHEDFLIVAGLGSTQEVSHITGEGAHAYCLGGAMGAACMMGFGLALARPDKHILVVTGDGELLMNLGSLANIAVFNPSNLSIVCVDNGHYGETGYQKSHTSLGVDLERIASGSGISRTMTVGEEGQIDAASKMIREKNGTSFVLLRVKPEDSFRMKPNLDGPVARAKFRRALLGTV